MSKASPFKASMLARVGGCSGSHLDSSEMPSAFYWTQIFWEVDVAGEIPTFSMFGVRWFGHLWVSGIVMLACELPRRKWPCMLALVIGPGYTQGS